MQPFVIKIHKALIKKQKTLAVAESCTGGLLSSFLTTLPGSSNYYILGVVAYDNKAKENILKIPHSVIQKNGAVSKAVTEMMANSVRRLANADYGIGITGIAGPGGAAPKKPIGTVFIAVIGPCKKISEKFNFKGNRNLVQRQAALMALELLQATLR
jgi:nicotinamide-nucleotide amidase